MRVCYLPSSPGATCVPTPAARPELSPGVIAPGRFRMLSVWRIMAAFIELFLRAGTLAAALSSIILQNPCSAPLGSPGRNFSPFSR